MPAFSDVQTSYSAAVTALRKRGFQVWYDRRSKMVMCERGGWDFMAETPPALLGLVTIYEDVAPTKYTPNWWQSPGDDSYSTLPESPQPYARVFAVRAHGR